MKRFKRVLVLAAVLLAASVGTIAVMQYEEKQEQIRNSDTVVLSIPPDTVESLSWSYDDEGLAFHREEDIWLYDDDEAFPVSGEKISEILGCFESLGASFIIEAVEDRGQYGLDDPECVISLSDGEQSWNIRLGSFSKMDQKRYVDIGDGNVYLVSSDPMEALESELSGMILHDVTPDFENVVDITFEGSENYTVVKTENSTDTYNSQMDIYFTAMDGKTVPLDTDSVDSYLSTITSLSLANYVTYNVTEDELTEFGLEEPELSISVSYTLTDEDEKEISDTCVIHIGQNVTELAEYNEAEAAGQEDLPDVTKYLRVGQSRIVYEITDWNYICLTDASYDDLRHSEVIWADLDTVTQIDVELEETTHTLVRQTDDEDGEDRWYYLDEEVDMDRILSALEGLKAASFTDESPDQLEEIGLTVYLDNESFPQVTIQLYRYDGSLCLAVVDGQSVSLVNRSDVVELVESVQEIVLGR